VPTPDDCTHSAFTCIVAERGKRFRRCQSWRFSQEAGTGVPFVFVQVKPQPGCERLGLFAAGQIGTPI